MNTQEYNLSSSHNHDDRYPTVTTETRQTRNDDYWGVNAKIINLKTCKIVHLNVFAKDGKNFTNSWSQLLSGIPSDLRPSQDVYTGIGRFNADLRLMSTGVIEGIANTSKNISFTVTFTYVVI